RKSMNSGRPSQGQGAHNHTAQPSNTNRKPTYMGLRVRRYTPPLTSDDAVSGLSGFTVVRERRNSTTPARLVTAPSNTQASAATSRSVVVSPGTGSVGANAHMPIATSNATNGGGMRASSHFMEPSFLLY